MSDLLERAENALRGADAATTAAKAATAGRALDEVSQQLRELRQRLKTANLRRASLQAGAFGVGSWPDPSKARANVAAYQEAVESDPAGARGELKSAIAALSKFIGVAEERVAKSIDACRDSLRDELKSVEDLADVEGFRERVAEIRRDAERLLEEGQRWKGADAASLEQILERRAALEARLEPLVRSDVPVAVRQFFRDARKTGARLEALTGEVQAWLRARGYENRLFVIIK